MELFRFSLTVISLRSVVWLSMKKWKEQKNYDELKWETNIFCFQTAASTKTQQHILHIYVVNEKNE